MKGNFFDTAKGIISFINVIVTVRSPRGVFAHQFQIVKIPINPFGFMTKIPLVIIIKCLNDRSTRTPFVHYPPVPLYLQSAHTA